MTEQYVEVSNVAQVPAGTMRRFDVGQRRILIANIDGRCYATDDRCTHEDASLSTGSLKGELVKCPLHGSRFNLRTGEALEDPAEENLRTYPVRQEGGRILVALPEDTGR